MLNTVKTYFRADVSTVSPSTEQKLAFYCTLVDRFNDIAQCILVMKLRQVKEMPLFSELFCCKDVATCTFMTRVQFLMSMGNWSVSQPRSGEPVLESIEPRNP